MDGDNRPQPTRPGDACGNPACECGGRIKVHTTRINLVSGRRVRYLHCDACGWIPADAKWVIPLEHAPPRR